MHVYCFKTREIVFQDASEVPWGLGINTNDDWTDWRVWSVDVDKQAHLKGIQFGSKIVKIDGDMIDEKNCNLVKQKLLAGKDTIIEFSKPVNLEFLLWRQGIEYSFLFL